MPEKQKINSKQHWIKENLESLVIAFIMAIIIRCFCIEVFQIPTGSMEPTLHGNPKTGDRIIVNKFYYKIFEPERFDVVVFKFPLNLTKNYIKRLVGLPEESILLSNGNVYYNPLNDNKETFFLAKKPFSTQQNVWIKYYENNFDDLISIKNDWFLPAFGCTTTPNHGMNISPQKNTSSTIRFSKDILTQIPYLPTDRRSYAKVCDVKLKFDLSLKKEQGEILCGLGDKYYKFDAHIPISGKKCTLLFRQYKNKGNSVLKRKSLPFEINPLEIGEKYKFEIMKYDGEFIISINDTRVFSFTYETELNKSQYLKEGVSARNIYFGTKSAFYNVSNVELYRDLSYTEEGVLNNSINNPLKIPKNSFFMMGDNTTNSKDSRLWEKSKLTLSNKQTLFGDTQKDPEPNNMSSSSFIRDPNPENIFGDPDHSIFVDVWGSKYIFNNKNYKVENITAPFVDRSEIVGKAFIIWWPPKRIGIIK